MSEKQLTVAELLAKAGKESPSGTPRTRRRRSVEDGGVSVAELTGRIPKVDAKPVESRHSSEPLDPTPDESQTTVFEAVNAPEPAATTGGHRVVEPEDTPEPPASSRRPAARKPVGASPIHTAGSAGTTAATPPRSAKKPILKPAMKPVMKPVMPVADDRTTDTQTPQAPPADAYEPISDATTATGSTDAVAGATTDRDELDVNSDSIVLSVVSEDEPVRLTTGSFPAVKTGIVTTAALADLAQAPVAAVTDIPSTPSPAEEALASLEHREQTVVAGTGDDEVGGVDASSQTVQFAAVDVDAAEQAHPDADYADYDDTYTDDAYSGENYADGDYADGDYAAADYVDEYADGDYAAADYTDDYADGYVEGEYADDDYDDGAYDDAAVAEYEPAAGAFHATPYDAPDEPNVDAYHRDAADDGAETGGKMSILAIVGMSLVGIIIGAGLFYGFQLLWASMDKKIVAALAVAVTIVLVGVVHVLRTARDGFSMALAAIVGLVMTFGPLAIVGL